MKTIKEKISFKIYKKGRKWIQCFINYKIDGKEYSHQGKVLMNDFLKTKNVGEWINNLPATIEGIENNFSAKYRIDYVATPIESDNEEAIFHFGKYKFENISKVAEKDLNYLIYMQHKVEGTVKQEIENVLSNYKIVEKAEDIYHYGFDVRRNQHINSNPKIFEGYELVLQESFDDQDGFLVQRDIYKKI
ncbi:hypothetical protein ALC152_05180 [Arcobacter sp. 15-2]|uniref:hypothetical protein n=1 Tax=Arcobacter sp. 15-2 TaxID=3374109 RepID=UPI00399CE8C9